MINHVPAVREFHCQHADKAPRQVLVDI